MINLLYFFDYLNHYKHKQAIWYQFMNFSRKYQHLSIRFLIWLTLLLVLQYSLAACTAEEQTTPQPKIENTPTITPTATRIPTKDPNLGLGTSENPIKIAYIISGDPQTALQSSAAFISQLSNETDLVYEFVPYQNPTEAFEDLRIQKFQFIWLQPLTYLAAEERELATPILLSNHFGLYRYGTQIFANISSNFIVYFDPASSTTTSNPDVALNQLEGKRPCWTDPSSLSGTIMPSGYLALYGIHTQPPVFVQNHTSVIRALYIKEICDFGATFGYSGDPRTSSGVIRDLPDAIEKIVVIWRSEPNIPSLNLSVAQNVPENITLKTKSALILLIRTDEGKKNLSQALSYDVQDLLEINAQYYNGVRDLVKAAGIVPYQHLGY
jgi:phosphonate transport system substrate-binding protein